MAKDRVEVDVVVDDKGTTKKVGMETKELGDSLDQTSKSSRTATRNIKGVAQTASAGGKNFSKMAQGISSGIVPAYAVLAANIFAVTAAFNFLKRAADLTELKKSQMEFAATTGMGMTQITSSLREASNGMLGFREAAEAAAIGSAKGFSPEMMEKMAVGATKASKALGRDFADSFDRIVRGVSKAEPELLDELGITLRLETASKNYAKQLGLEADQLTASQRSMAVYLEVQKQLDDQYGAIEGAENPYQKLAKTFDDIVNKITQAVLPAFNAFATLIADNAGIAMVFFTSIGLSIARTFPMFDGAKAKFADWESETQQGLDNMERDYDDYIEKIEATEAAIKELERVEADSQLKAKKSATETVTGDDGVKGRKGSGLAILQEGGTPSKRQLNAMLKSAKNNTGEYKKLSEDKRKQFIADIEKMMKKEGDFQRGSRKAWRAVAKVPKRVYRFMRDDWKKTMLMMEIRAQRMAKRVGRSFKWMGKQINWVVRKLPFIGVFMMISNALQGLLTMPYDALMGIVDFGMRSAQTIMNLIDSLVKGFKWLVNKIPGMEDTFTADELKKGVGKEWLITEEDIQNQKKIVGESGFGQAFLKQQEENLRASAIPNALEEIEQASADLRKDLEATSRSYLNLISGKGPDGEELSPEQAAKNQMKAFQAKAKALTSMNVMSQLDTGLTAVTAATRGKEMIEGSAKFKAAAKTANEQFLLGFKEELDKDGGKFEEMFKPLYDAMFPKGDDLTGLTVKGVQAIYEKSQLASKKWLDNISDTQEAMTAIRESFSGKNLHEADAQLKVFENIMRVFDETREVDPTHTNPFIEELNAMFGMDDKGRPLIGEYAQNLRAMIAEQQSILDKGKGLEIAKMDASRTLTGSSLKDEMERIAVLETELKLQAAILDIKIAEEAIRAGKMSEIPEAKKAALQDALDAAQRIKETSSTSVENAKAQMDDMKQAGLKLGAGLESSMSNAFQAIVTGSKSAKEAFADLARSMLTMIAKIITELAVAAMLKAALGGSTFGGWLGIDKARNGGIVDPPGLRYGGIAKNKRYAGGGIASGRDAGYPAILHGTEAVVPLPNSREIPVDLRGSGQQNNVTVNVTMDNSGNRSDSTSDSTMGEKMGQVIAQAVQEELQYQKRSGGILNPYGVA